MVSYSYNISTDTIFMQYLHFVISKVNFYIPQSGSFQVVSNDSISISQLVHMVMSGWSEEHLLMRDEWRCARVDSGGLCVMIYGADSNKYVPL